MVHDNHKKRTRSEKKQEPIERGMSTKSPPKKKNKIDITNSKENKIKALESELTTKNVIIANLKSDINTQTTRSKSMEKDIIEITAENRILKNDAKKNKNN